LPLYEAIRDYLEIGPRVQVLNDRLAVTGDLLGIIHDYIDQDKMHQITWIVIILISESPSDLLLVRVLMPGQSSLLWLRSVK
jgi:uncharacterized Rmd1/YagE family protein